MIYILKLESFLITVKTFDKIISIKMMQFTMVTMVTSGVDLTKKE